MYECTFRARGCSSPRHVCTVHIVASFIVHDSAYDVFIYLRAEVCLLTRNPLSTASGMYAGANIITSKSHIDI